MPRRGGCCSWLGCCSKGSSDDVVDDDDYIVVDVVPWKDNDGEASDLPSYPLWWKIVRAVGVVAALIVTFVSKPWKHFPETCFAAVVQNKPNGPPPTSSNNNGSNAAGSSDPPSSASQTDPNPDGVSRKDSDQEKSYVPGRIEFIVIRLMVFVLAVGLFLTGNYFMHISDAQNAWEWNADACHRLNATALNIEMSSAAWKYFSDENNRRHRCVVTRTKFFRQKKTKRTRFFFDERVLLGYFARHGLDATRNDGLVTVLWTADIDKFEPTNFQDFVRSWDGAWAFPNLKTARHYFDAARETGHWDPASTAGVEILAGSEDQTTTPFGKYLFFNSEKALGSHVRGHLERNELPFACKRSDIAPKCQRLAIRTASDWILDDPIHSLTEKYIPDEKLKGVAKIPRAEIGSVLFTLAIKPEFQPKVLKWYKDGLVKTDVLTIKPLGAGSSGIAWKAHHEYSGHNIVLKQMYEPDELLHEADCTLHLIGCPNVVQMRGIVLGSKTHNGLLVEYYSGGEFYQWTRKKPSPVESAIVLSQIARGMVCIVERGYTHNDLAGRNVMFDHNKVPIIIDTGFALSSGSSSPDKLYNIRNTGEQDPKTIPKHLFGFEQVSYNKRGKCEQSDVYSFGGLICQIMLPETRGLRIWYDMLKQQYGRWNVKIPPHLGRGKGEIMDGVRGDVEEFAKLQALMRRCYGRSSKRNTFRELEVILKKIADES
eukprot:213985_1